MDAFYAANWPNFVNIMNIKRPNYVGLKIDAYMVNMNNHLVLSEERIKLYKIRRFAKLEPNIKIMNATAFIELIKTFEPLEIKGDLR